MGVKPEMEVAETIRQQLGRRALFMWGAKDLVGSLNSLIFRVGNNDKKITKVVIRYEAGTDTYTVSFWGRRAREISSFEGIHADGLRGLIASETGMDASL